jgi:outer membrane protein TolC
VVATWAASGQARAEPPSLEDALATAATSNPTLASARLTWRIVSEQAAVEQAPFDWYLESSVDYTRVLRVPAVITEPDDYQRVFGTINVRRLFETGTAASAGVSMQWEDFGLDPNPVFPRPTSFRPTLFLGVEQSLLRGLGPEVRNTPEALALLDAQAASLAQQETASAVAAEVCLAWLEVIRAKTALQATEIAIEGANVQLAAAQARVDARQSAPSELLAIKQAVSARRSDKIRGEAALANATRALLAAMGELPPTDGAPVGPASASPSTTAASLPPALSSLPALDPSEASARAEDAFGHRRAEIDVARAERALVQTHNATLPDLSLSAQVSLTATDEDLAAALRDVATADNPQFTVGVSVALPLVNAAAAATHQQALLTAERARATTDSALLTEQREAMRLATEAAAARAVAEELERSLGLAEQAWAAEQDKFVLGATTAQAVLQLLSTAEDARRLYWDTRLAEISAKVSLHHRLGSLLGHLGITVVP